MILTKICKGEWLTISQSMPVHLIISVLHAAAAAPLEASENRYISISFLHDRYVGTLYLKILQLPLELSTYLSIEIFADWWVDRMYVLALGRAALSADKINKLQVLLKL